jgi:Rps23 Pro-64 3,4-dihydroxylase Tpa1-like proline 4-hydroxylase
MSITTYKISKKPLIVVDNLLTSSECEELITYMESQKHEKIQSIGTSYNRVILISDEYANLIHKRISHILPKHYREDISINTYFRFSKYVPGEYFSIHKDGLNQNREGKRTIMTVNIFLNNECEGGSTSFYDDNHKKVVSVFPKVGTGAIFDREIYHSGDRVTSGIKYLFRTDVMQ